jgi:hypothetical protein
MFRSCCSLAFIFLSLLIISSCKKDNNKPNPPQQTPPDPGTFKISFNNENWTAPERHKVFYFPKRQELYVSASGDTSSYFCGIRLDPSNITKTYILQNHGTNLASFIAHDNYTSTLFNVADIGGSFTITKFDTVQKKFSATFNYVAYDLSRKIRYNIQSVDVTDIPINIDDTTTYAGNTAQLTFIGAQTATWNTSNITTGINCYVKDGRMTYNVLSVNLYSISSMRRTMKFNIPLWFKTGSYPITPSYFNDCDELRIFARYTPPDGPYFSYPTSGSMQITSIDTIAKSLKTTFSYTFRDTLFKENIQVTNGSLDVKW